MRAPTLAAGVAPHNHFERAHRALLDSGRGPEYFPLCRLHSLQRYGPASSRSSAREPLLGPERGDPRVQVVDAPPREDPGERVQPARLVVEPRPEGQVAAG